MLKIRLKRVGRKNDPSYRVVLIDSHKGPKSGKINEVLGFYDPRRDIKEIKAERVKEWMSKGAQVSDTVHNILVSEKVIEGKKINVLPKKSPIIKELEEGEKSSEKGEATEASSESPDEKVLEKESETPSSEDSFEKVKEKEMKESSGETDSQEKKEAEPENSSEPEEKEVKKATEGEASKAEKKTEE